MKKTLMMITVLLVLFAYLANAGDTKDIAFSTTVTPIHADGRKVMHCVVLKSELNKTTPWYPKNAKGLPFDITELKTIADEELIKFSGEKFDYFRLAQISIERSGATDKWIWRYRYINKNNLGESYDVIGYLNGKVQLPKDTKDNIHISDKSTPDNEDRKKVIKQLIMDDYVVHKTTLQAVSETGGWNTENELPLPIGEAMKVAEKSLSEFLPTEDNLKKKVASIVLRKLNFNSDYWFYVFRYRVKKGEDIRTACVPVLFNRTVAVRQKSADEE